MSPAGGVPGKGNVPVFFRNPRFRTLFLVVSCYGTFHNISPPLDARKRKDFFPDSTVPKTNLAGWKTTMFNRKYIFIHGGFSIAILVFVGENNHLLGVA